MFYVVLSFGCLEIFKKHKKAMFSFVKKKIDSQAIYEYKFNFPSKRSIIEMKNDAYLPNYKTEYKKKRYFNELGTIVY